MRDSNCSTSCWITEAISSALNLMNTPIDHLLANGLQLVGDGAVVDGVADAEDGPADQRRIDDGLQNRLAAQQRRGVGGDLLELRPRPTAWPWSARTRTLPCISSYSLRAWRRIARRQSRRPCRDTTLRKFSSRREICAAKTRSSTPGLFLVRRPAASRGPSPAWGTGQRPRSTMASNSSSTAAVWPPLLRGAQQGAGVDLADLLRAYVGREAGRVVGIAGNDVVDSAMADWRAGIDGFRRITPGFTAIRVRG